jgi:F-type H+-transporting ATPase subunit delta
MSNQRVATRYAKSLIDLAVERGKLEKVLEDMKSFRQVAMNRDFALLLKSPIVKADKKQQIFKQLFEGKSDELTMAFLNILLKKGREAGLVEIADEFILQYKRIQQISTVKLTTASKLSESTIETIRQKLVASTATDQKVELVTEVKPGLIGGFVIEFEDKLYDASVAHKMGLLKKEFKDNLYISQIIAQ